MLTLVVPACLVFGWVLGFAMGILSQPKQASVPNHPAARLLAKTQWAQSEKVWSDEHCSAIRSLGHYLADNQVPESLREQIAVFLKSVAKGGGGGIHVSNTAAAALREGPARYRMD